MDNMVSSAIYWQQELTLAPLARGFHLISSTIINSLKNAPPIETGLMHLFLRHTSASLAISENSCQDVPLDLESHLNQLIPDNNQLYRHTLEGPDDMPAHIKNVMLGCSLAIPIYRGHLALGQWQGIFLCEHRNKASSRNLILTVHGI